MSSYHEGQRQLQDRFDSRRLADRLDQTIIHDTITPDDRAFIESREFFFLSTVDAEGQPNCSFKGGPAGFVKVMDERTIAFPSYDGNGMFLSMGNLLANPRVGILFIDFERPSRLRLNGTASIDHDDPLIGEFHEAQFVVRVTVKQIFPNCPRYIPRLQRVEDSPYVPRPDRDTPFPNWKQIDFVRDTLPAKDLSRVSELPPITIEEFVASIK
jgi:predicted pyridoxine 5'-phosphate oxidase superfamily flavin-nucleotide-binding protein